MAYDESMPNKSYLSRTIRLLRLIQELQSHPGQTPEALQKRLGIGRSTFHDDKNALKELGFEWEYCRRQQKYILKGDATPPVLNLSLHEAMALILAVRQFSASGDSTLVFDAVEGMKKIVAAASGPVHRLLQGTLNDILHKTFRATPEVLKNLVEGQKNQLYLTIQYCGHKHKANKPYKIAPYQIFFQARALYVDAYVPARSQIETFRVSRIQKVEEIGGGFEIRPEYDFAGRHRHTFRAIRGDGIPQRVKIQFAPQVADLIDESHWHDSERKLMGRDGSLILTLEVSHPQEVLWFLVMPYAEYAEILEPEWLKQEFLRIGQAIVRKFKK